MPADGMKHWALVIDRVSEIKLACFPFMVDSGAPDSLTSIGLWGLPYQ